MQWFSQNSYSLTQEVIIDCVEIQQNTWSKLFRYFAVLNSQKSEHKQRKNGARYITPGKIKLTVTFKQLDICHMWNILFTLSVLERSWVQIPFRPVFFSGFNFTGLEEAMHVELRWSIMPSSHRLLQKRINFKSWQHILLVCSFLLYKLQITSSFNCFIK